MHASEPHFHIHWIPTDKLDWQLFEARSDAEHLANDLKRDNERFVIEEFLADCPVCRQALRSRTAGHS